MIKLYGTGRMGCLIVGWSGVRGVGMYVCKILTTLSTLYVLLGNFGTCCSTVWDLRIVVSSYRVGAYMR